MPRRRYLFDPPERFVAGTVGEPGDRTFFLQARDGPRVVSVVLEKVQVAVLAERLGELLAELERRGVAGRRGGRDADGRDRRHRTARRAAQRGVPGRVADARLGRRRRAGPRRGARPVRGRRGDRPRRGRRRGRGRPRPAARPDDAPMPPARSSPARRGSSPPAGRPARCAARRSTRRATSARAATATTSTRPAVSVLDRGDDARRPARRRARDRRAHRRVVEQRDARRRVTRGLPRPGAAARPRRRLQADPRRAPARRLPGRHAGPPRGGRLARVGGDAAGASSRRPSCATGPFGEGMVQAFVEADPEVDVVGDGRRGRRRGCAGWRSSTRS